MNYCEKCHTLCDENSCPVCGNKALREPEHDDFVFLTERAPMWAEMLRAAMDDTGIPSAYQPLLGMGVTFGAGKTLDRHQIFVPYEHLQAARDVMLALFGETQQSRSPHSIFSAGSAR